ncbi:MAG: hypothetical protein M1823_003888 [Watsoniomyces obsoletus]|nr:MAG: hypothetical protein M1823_003888 [Watsoniomyces obsoletus]
MRPFQGDPDGMSRTSPTQNPASSKATTDGSSSSAGVVVTAGPATSSMEGRRPTSSRREQQQQYGHRAVQEGPVVTAVATTESRATPVTTAPMPDPGRASRSLNVSLMLNPTQPDVEGDPSSPYEREPTDRLPPPTTTRAPITLPFPPPQSTTRRGYSSVSEAGHGYGSPGGGEGASTQPSVAPMRRILTPKSPSLRAVSMGGRLSLPNPLAGSGPPSSMTPGRTSTTTDFGVLPPPSDHVPPLPTPPLLSRGGGGSYGFPSMGGASSRLDRRASVGPMTAPVSQSASPSTSYSSYGQPGYPSPAAAVAHSASMSAQAPLAGRTITTAMGMTTTATMEASGMMASSEPATPLTMGSSFRSASGMTLTGGHQEVLTLNTREGPIEVPLDVQAASKMADDRRKRNAGASARFRQRRKEKEREASQTIAKLEQRIRDVTEERDHYRHERDHFQRLVQTVPGPIPPQPPRPISPARRRRSMQSGEAGTVREAAPAAVATPSHPPPPPPTTGPWGAVEGGGEVGMPDRNVRRRTSAFAASPYTLPPPPMQASAPMVPGIPMRLGAPPPPPPHASHPAVGPPIPGYEGVSPGAPQRPSGPLPPPPSRPEEYDPYAADRYDRGWYLPRPSR